MTTTKYTNGEDVDDFLLNNRTQIPIDGLLAPPLAIMRESVAHSWAGATFSAGVWDATDKDTAGGHTATDRYVFQSTGVFAASADVSFAASTATGYVGACFELNGSSSQRFAASTQAKLNDSVVRHIALPLTLIIVTSVGTYLRVMGANGTGSAINSAPSDIGNPRFCIWRISD